MGLEQVWISRATSRLLSRGIALAVAVIVPARQMHGMIDDDEARAHIVPKSRT